MWKNIEPGSQEEAKLDNDIGNYLMFGVYYDRIVVYKNDMKIIDPRLSSTSIFIKGKDSSGKDHEILVYSYMPGSSQYGSWYHQGEWISDIIYLTNLVKDKIKKDEGKEQEVLSQYGNFDRSKYSY